MGARVAAIIMVLLLCGTSAQAQLILLWDYPRDGQPMPEFLVTTVNATEPTGQPTQLQVAASPPGACLGLPTATQDTLCAELPCPGPGAYVITLQALRGGTVSGPSNVVTTGIRAGSPCTWVALDQLPMASPPPVAGSMGAAAQVLASGSAATPPAPPVTAAQPVPSGTPSPVHPTTDTSGMVPTTPSAAAPATLARPEPDCTKPLRQQRRHRAP